MPPYIPCDLPLRDLDLVKLITLVGKSNSSLASYSSLLQTLDNPSVMLSPLTFNEAVLSSKIEGTQATLGEVFEHQAGKEFSDRKNEDIQEILNYRKALRLAQRDVRDRPITLTLLLGLHRILLRSVRGQNKSPGEFRREQNWIGSPGDPIEKATFVPPSPLQLIDHLQKWESYLRYDDIDPLVQAAVVHAQFELLHPFKDGNGRIGRLLIPLFLYSKKCLDLPMFYLSEFLEEHRDEYYFKLQKISQDNDWTGWVEFFLSAIIEQSSDNSKKVRAINDLRNTMKYKVTEITKSSYSAQVLDCLFSMPSFRASDFCDKGKIPMSSTQNIIKLLTKEGIVKVEEERVGRTPARYSFPALLKLIDKNIVV